MWLFLASLTKNGCAYQFTHFFTYTIMEVAFIPKWLIKYISSNSTRQYEVNILISNILIISLFILFNHTLLRVMNAVPHFCLFDKILGIQCPVCGMTRAFCELSQSNIKEAIQLNLSSLFVASFFIFQIPLRICSLCKPQMQKNISKISKVFSYFVIIVIVANWLINLIISYL